jgi:hypothetical protein
MYFNFKISRSFFPKMPDQTSSEGRAANLAHDHHELSSPKIFEPLEEYQFCSKSTVERIIKVFLFGEIRNHRICKTAGDPRLISEAH